jgi:hypothetical protein
LRREFFEMAENLPNGNTGNAGGTVVVVNQQKSAAIGICALIFAILGLFFFAIIFVPLSLILAVIAILKRQFVWGICAIIIAGIAAWLSPTIWLMLGIGNLAAYGPR